MKQPRTIEEYRQRHLKTHLEQLDSKERRRLTGKKKPFLKLAYRDDRAGSEGIQPGKVVLALVLVSVLGLALFWFSPAEPDDPKPTGPGGQFTISPVEPDGRKPLSPSGDIQMPESTASLHGHMPFGISESEHLIARDAYDLVYDHERHLARYVSYRVNPGKGSASGKKEDPDIPEDDQRKKAARGHEMASLVIPQLVNGANNLHEIEYYTVKGPMYRSFRSSGRKILANRIKEMANKAATWVVVGPVWGDVDPREAKPLPEAWFFLVIRRKGELLQPFAFIYDRKDEKMAVPSDYRVTVADVERRTGLMFFTNPKVTMAGSKTDKSTSFR